MSDQQPTTLRLMKDTMRTPISTLALVALATSSAWAEPFASTPATASLALPDLSGTWRGTGEVQRNENADPINVRCEITGTGNTNNTEFGFAGACRALLIMKREIGAEIVRRGERFSGIYTGSNAGPAALSGTMTEPDTLTLNMRFEREINGDDQAVMTIRRPTDNTFTIVTRDKMESGAEIVTADITFSRED